MKGIDEELADLEARNLRREVTAMEGPVEATSRRDDNVVLRLASNAYLGLNRHPRVVAAAQKAADAIGTGAGASPLVSGQTEPVASLEDRLADLKGCEDCVVFPSGYHANTGAIPVLAGEGDLIVSDELNHASIVDGCRASPATVEVYPHADPQALDAVLAEHRADQDRCLVVTDGVFSMDADLAPLPEVASVADDHGASLMVDDAHATGVLGDTGAGTSEHFGLAPDAVDVQMGTLSKALASQGGFVAASEPVCELLRNRARSYVFSTALAPPAAAAARAALAVLDEEPDRLEALHANADRLRDGLEDAGFDVLGEQTPIVPVLVGEAEPALELSERLLDRAIFCPAIRPPSVPEGTSRLRATVMATHSKRQVDRAVQAFEDAGRAAGVLA